MNISSITYDHDYVKGEEYNGLTERRNVHADDISLTKLFFPVILALILNAELDDHADIFSFHWSPRCHPRTHRFSREKCKQVPTSQKCRGNHIV